MGRLKQKGETMLVPQKLKDFDKQLEEKDIMVRYIVECRIKRVTAKMNAIFGAAEPISDYCKVFESLQEVEDFLNGDPFNRTNEEIDGGVK